MEKFTRATLFLTLIFSLFVSTTSHSEIDLDLNQGVDFELGDWGSAGGMPIVVPVDYPFLYNCEIQLTDQRNRIDQNGHVYWAVAQARFNFNNDVTYMRSESLEWDSLRYYPDRIQVFRSPTPLPFSTDGQYATISVTPNLNGSDSVVLGLHVSQTLGDYRVQEFESHAATRADERLFIENSLTVLRGSEPTDSYLLRMFCDKRL